MGKDGTWMGTYLHRNLSTYVLKINMFNKKKIENMSSCLIATFWIMPHLKCPIRYDVFEDCLLLKGFI